VIDVDRARVAASLRESRTLERRIFEVSLKVGGNRVE
jgi:hypothetical protein